VDPSYYTWYPNVSLFTRGILIDGAPKDMQWVVVRLYQGDATDQFAMNIWPDPYRKMESRSTYRIRVNRSGCGSDGIDEEHSWVSMGIVAPWYYAQFGNVHLHVTVHYTDGKAISVDVRDWLRCERGLTSGGNLELVDGEGNVHRDGDWVRAGIDATLRGVHLTFPDGLHVPDPGDIRLVLTVGDTPHPAVLGPDGAITAALQLPADTGHVDIMLDIANRWTGFRTNHTMTVRLDADPPSFLSFFPENGTWLADVHFTMGCLLTDGEGSGVGDVQVRYWLSGEMPGDWVDADTADRQSVTMAAEGMHIEEGNWSIEWRAWDRVWNGPVTSPVFTIHVDLTIVVFRDFTPEGWVNNTPVEVTFTVEDVGGSGVDLGSIEYTYSTEGMFDLTEWASAGLSGTQEDVVVKLTLPFEEGVDNVVVVRASDAVGNSRSSSVYHVFVDLTLPTFLDPVPGEGDVVANATVVECGIYVDDAYSGVDTVEYRYSIGTDSWSEWMAASSTLEDGPFWTAGVKRKEGGPTSIQWRARDRAGTGTTNSDVYVVNLNRPPEIVELVPTSRTDVREGERVTFSVEFLDPEGDDVVILWWLDGEEVSESDAFSTGLPLGEHSIRLVLDDGQGNTVEADIEVSSVERTELTSGEGWPFLLMLLVILIVVAVIVYSMRNRGPVG